MHFLLDIDKKDLYNIRTSYFRVAGNFSNSLSIVPDTPQWYCFNQATELVPDKKLYFSYIHTHKITRKEFILEYINNQLSLLDPYDILNKYNGKILLGKSKLENNDIYFCPRSVIISWLKLTTGYEIKELTPLEIKNKLV